MSAFERLKKYLYLDTFGWIAVASVLICALSGVFLAVPYDTGSPYVSITRFLICNPPANFIRNLHFWSAQLFLIFTLLHIYDHLNRSTEDNIRRKRTWLLLTFSIAFMGYVMISGFMLKADADSIQARRILSSLMESIPWLGTLVQRTFIGKEGNWQMLYVQHITTGTIILFIAIYDHVHTIWVNIRTFIVVILATSVLSWIFPAPLSSLNEAVMKGPWYFVGLQEGLHWISLPGLVTALVFLLLLVIGFLPEIKPVKRRIIKKILLGVVVIYVLMSITGFFFRGENWQLQKPWEKGAILTNAFHIKPVDFTTPVMKDIPVVRGKAEACLACHAGMQGLSDSHSAGTAGCYSCHLGDPFTLNKNQAHRGMERVPGNLSNADRTCGTSGCHPQITSRIKVSLMATLSGMISVDRFVFGETASLKGQPTVNELGFSAADSHLRNLCAGCHLGNEKTRAGKAAWLGRGGGCNACHLTYNAESQKDLAYQQKKDKGDTMLPSVHPAIDLKISNDKCLSCHSRSGRISMNYEGWHETTIKTVSPDSAGKYRAVPDGRIFTFIGSDIHHQKGMLCIDCHGSWELMGDGKQYSHMEEAVKVQCADCHPKGKASNTMNMNDADRETLLIAWLRKDKTEGFRIAFTGNGKIPLVNTRIDEAGQLELISKLSGKGLTAKLQNTACSAGKAHERLSCNACHTAWVPQCIGCHTGYEKNTIGFDMVQNRQTKGAWVEYAGKYMADAPVLGINMKSGKNGMVETMAPGMIMTIDKGSYDPGEKTGFHRLYAPASAHTTQQGSRSCKSCHSNSLALGFGRGDLVLSPEGRWKFNPHYALNQNDGLPEDAWTGFLVDRNDNASTRTGIRPFNPAEQKKILSVGACLGCHDEKSAVMKQTLVDFGKTKSRMSRKCRFPV